MPISNLTFFGGDIPDPSDGTPGLWNRRFSTISQNLDDVNQKASTITGSFPSSIVTGGLLAGKNTSLYSFVEWSGASQVVQSTAADTFPIVTNTPIFVSVSATTFTGNLVGNASTATNVAGTGLTGTTLASNIVTSSLTTIGTLVGGAVPFTLLTGALAYGQLPSGGGTWANGGALSITGGDTTVVNLIAGNVTGTLLTASQPNVTGVGALAAGSIVPGFGNINNAGNSLTTGAIVATSVDLTGRVFARVDDNNIFVRPVATTGAIQNSLISRSELTSGAFADGFGAGLIFQTKASDGTLYTAGGIAGVRNGADDTYDVYLRTAIAGVMSNQVLVRATGAVDIPNGLLTASGNITAVGTGANFMKRNTATTNAVVAALVSYAKLTAGSLADGFGASLLFQIEDSAGNTRNTGRLATQRNGGDTTHDVYVHAVSAGSLVQVAKFGADLSSTFAGTVSVGNQLWLANIAAATVGVGAIADKVPVYDTSGTLKGYLPIYATIT